MTTMTLAPADLDRVLPGDRIVAIDGTPLDRAHTVRERPAADGSVPLVNPTGSGVDWRLYPASHVTTSVTVERDDPPAAAPRPRGPVTRTVDGLRLVSQGDAFWTTEDGAWVVRYDTDYLTMCEAPHPMRARAEDDGRWLTDEARVRLQAALRAGRRFYQCPGGEEHTYGRWSLWSVERDDYAPWTSSGEFDTFTDAARDLARHLRREG